MIRYKTYDATGIAPNGRLTAGDMNLFQDLVAALTDLAQNVSVGSLAVGQAGLTISRFGAGEFQFAGLARIQGIARFLGGFIGGTFTTTARNAIAAGSAPFGLIILNSDTGRYEWNAGTDGARNWQPLSPITGPGTITATELATDAVTSIKIQADAVTQAKMADNSVGTAEIIDGSVTVTELATDSVNAAKIVDGSVGTAELGTDAVTQIKMADNSVGTAEIIDGSVTTSELGTDAVTNIKMADNSVGAAEIIDGSVGSAELATDAVTNIKMANLSVGTAELIDGSVTQAKHAANSVGSPEIIDGSVGSAELATDAVTNIKVADNAVGTAEIIDGSVTAAELATDAVTNVKIADNAVGTAEIIADAVTGAKIAPGHGGSDDFGTAFPTTGLFNGYQFTLFMSASNNGNFSFTEIMDNVIFECVYRADIDATYPWQVKGAKAFQGQYGITTSTGGINLLGFIYAPRNGVYIPSIDGTASSGGGGGSGWALLASVAGAYDFQDTSGQNIWIGFSRQGVQRAMGGGVHYAQVGLNCAGGNSITYNGKLTLRPVRLI